MRTCRFVGVLFCLALFLIVLLMNPVLAAPEGQQEKSDKWWPSVVINPPEVEALFRVIDEKIGSVYILPQTNYDPQVVMVEWEPELIVDAAGTFVGIGVSVLVTKRIKSRYVLRQFRYHRIWARNLKDIFYDTSFLSRTAEENRKLAYDDESAYWKRVAEAMPYIKQEVVDDAVKMGREFTTIVTKGLSVTMPAHQALNTFAACFEHIFQQVFEPYVDVAQFDFEKPFLVFDYDPLHQNRFNVKTAVLFLVPLTGSGFVVSLFGEEQLVGEISVTDLCPTDYAGRLAKQAFRALSNLHAVEK